MKKRAVEEKMLQLAAKVISLEVKKNEKIWPPLCGGLVHQPMRPKAGKKIK